MYCKETRHRTVLATTATATTSRRQTHMQDVHSKAHMLNRILNTAVPPLQSPICCIFAYEYYVT